MLKINTGIKRGSLSIVVFLCVVTAGYYAVNLFLKQRPVVTFKASDTDSHIKFGVYSPNGKYLASCDSERRLKIWSIESKKCLHTFHHDGAISAVAFSPDSKVIACSDFNGNLNFRDSMTGKMIRHYKIEPVISIAFSKEGLFGYSTSNLRLKETNQNNTIKIIRWKTGEVVRNWVLRKRGIRYRVMSLVFSSDDNKIACITSGSIIILFDLHSKKPLWEIGREIGKTPWKSVDLNESIKFSPNGKYIVTTEAPFYSLGQLLSASDGSTHKTLKAIESTLDIRQSRMYFSKDGRLYIIGVNNNQVIFILNKNGRVLKKYKTGERESFDILDFCSNRNYLAIAYGRNIGIWKIN